MEYIPRSLTVTQSELLGKTTIEGAPDSEQAKIYRSLARRIDEHTESKTPNPLDAQQLKEWAATWAEQIIAVERGEVTSQAAGI
jgi:nitrogenase iron protein NifH